MSAKIIDGKAVAQHIRDQIRIEIEPLVKKPGLAVVIVGDDPASHTYVNSKAKACQEIGFHSEVFRLPETSTEKELLTLVQQLNTNPDIHGFLVQLPLPKHLDETIITYAIDPEKDVDCFHPINTGRIFNGDFSGVLPCTPAGTLELIRSTGVTLKGKKAVIVGRSNIVGKPAAMMMLNEHCTVTICHSRTENLAAEVRQADIVIAAVGRARIITGDMIKPGAVVIDVGTNRVDGKLVGDVAYDEVKEIAGFITPVPGGVGPMTIAMLMKNTLVAFKKSMSS